MGQAKRKSTEYIVVHCAATPPSMDIGVSEIDRWHRARGWVGVGYHFVVRRDGTLEKGRDIDAVGAHVKGYNNKSVGICLVGGVMEEDKKTPEDNFTQNQFDTVTALLKKLHDMYPESKIVGHRELDAGKACPCFDLAKVGVCDQ
jgi:N-acetylmuramoyl-L-alanine amidase